MEKYGSADEWMEADKAAAKKAGEPPLTDDEWMGYGTELESYRKMYAEAAGRRSSHHHHTRAIIFFCKR